MSLTLIDLGKLLPFQNKTLPMDIRVSLQKIVLNNSNGI